VKQRFEKEKVIALPVVPSGIISGKTPQDFPSFGAMLAIFYNFCRPCQFFSACTGIGRRPLLKKE